MPSDLTWTLELQASDRGWSREPLRERLIGQRSGAPRHAGARVASVMDAVLSRDRPAQRLRAAFGRPEEPLALSSQAMAQPPPA